MWSEYFSKGTVFGIDVYSLDQLHAWIRNSGFPDFLPDKPDTGRIKTFVADQANREQLKRFIDASGGDFDIVLDDGGHTMEQQQTSFGFFFKYVKPGGYYVIEDVHTSLPELYRGYGVQDNEANTTLTMITPSSDTAVSKANTYVAMRSHTSTVTLNMRPCSRDGTNLAVSV